MTETTTEAEKVLAWMHEKGLSLPDMARELGMSYDGVYQALRYRERVSDGIKLRFIGRFGMEEARNVFNGSTPDHVQVQA